MEAAGCRALKAHNEKLRAQDELIKRQEAIRQQQEEDEAQRVQRLEQHKGREKSREEAVLPNQQPERGTETCAAGSKTRPDEVRQSGSSGSFLKERRQKNSAGEGLGSKQSEMGKESSGPSEGEQATVQGNSVDEAAVQKTGRGGERLFTKWAKEEVPEKVCEQSPSKCSFFPARRRPFLRWMGGITYSAKMP